VLNTGHTVRKTLDVVEVAKGLVIGIAALYDRQDWEPALFKDLPVYSLVRLKLEESYPPEHCPLCRAGKPVNQHYGRGKDFAAGR
jgi:orotate phosphoribosyltransferase